MWTWVCKPSSLSPCVQNMSFTRMFLSLKRAGADLPPPYFRELWINQKNEGLNSPGLSYLSILNVSEEKNTGFLTQWVTARVGSKIEVKFFAAPKIRNSPQFFSELTALTDRTCIKMTSDAWKCHILFHFMMFCQKMKNKLYLLQNQREGGGGQICPDRPLEIRKKNAPNMVCLGLTKLISPSPSFCIFTCCLVK